ncbi:MAG: aminotransferase class III-fold pyridoxal phosphate-dependent enzyme [Kiloniellales bacterium]
MTISDLILEFDPPRFALDEAKALLATHFGLEGELSPLAGERDRNFRLQTADGRLFVLKISQADQDADRVDFEAEILAHLTRVAPKLAVPAGYKTGEGAYCFQARCSSGKQHLARLVTYLEGRPLASVTPLPAGVFFEMGRLQGEICRALASFFHPAARSPMPWNSSSDRLMDPDMLGLLDEELADAVAPHLPRLRCQSLPALQRQRSQVIHNDVHTGNVLLDQAGRVSGIIDFGDALHAPLLQDLAVSASSLAETFPNDAPAAIEELQRGFESAFPLLPEERALLLDAAILRSLLSVELGRIKVESSDGNERQRQVLEASRRGLLALLAQHQDRAPPPPKRKQSSGPLLERRRAVMSPTYKLFYDEPLEIVRGAGALLFDATGRDFLDCYNNVPSVGHGHPHVLQALRQQAEALNTHTRYLHDAVVSYGERLTATLPQALDMCLLVCTGSEANDLAFRIARAVTGREGVAVWEDCYHGNSARTAEISLYGKPPASYAPYIAALPVPGQNRSGRPDACAEQAIEALAHSPHGLAMMMVDSIFDGAGIFTAPEGYLAKLFDLVRGHGGLVVADEVQSGLCRLGDNMWGFQDSGVVPDIVTMGKPMGNGHPIAVVVAKRWILEAFAKQNHYFNTFGGNPVSAAVGNAVLDVVEKEAILASVHTVGRHLKAGLLALKERHHAIEAVRGKGFFLGVELRSADQTRAAAADLAAAVVNDLRRRGVLVTSSGPQGNVIKIRPPLIFSMDNAGRLLAALELSLASASAA